MTDFYGLTPQLLFYHIRCDYIMLFPALLAILVQAVKSPTPGWLALAGALAASLWLPARIFTEIPRYPLVQVLIWLIVAFSLSRRLTRAHGLSVSDEPALLRRDGAGRSEGKP